MKILSVVAEMIDADGETMRTKLSAAFRNFGQASKI
jgi:hypothetical protein